MEHISNTAIIIIAICVTFSFCFLVWMAKDGFKFKVDKSGINLEVADDDPDKTQSNKEIKNETDITV